MEKLIEKQSALDGYQYGLEDAKASLPADYENDTRHLYLLDKAKNTIRNHREYPIDYPNPSAALAYSFAAHIEPVLNILFAMTGDDSIQKAAKEWFFNNWVPKAESDLNAAQLGFRTYGKKYKDTQIFDNSINAFELYLMNIYDSSKLK